MTDGNRLGPAFEHENQPDPEPALFSKDLNYTYPTKFDGEEMDLRPLSPLHNKIIREINDRTAEAASTNQENFSRWDEINRVTSSFIPTKDLGGINNPRKPRTVVYPYSFAILETWLSYMTAVFFESPIFKYKGWGPEDKIGAALLERVIEWQCQRSKTLIHLHTHCRDALTYGLGFTAQGWDARYGKRLVVSPYTQERETLDYLEYEGFNVQPIDPYRALPDPNVPAWDVQNAEYFGWVERSNRLKLLEMEKQQGTDYFNCQYLSGLAQGTTSYLSTVSNRPHRKEALRDHHTTTPLDVTKMYVNLIPYEWHLGPSRHPERWYFEVVGDRIVIQAKPLGLIRDMIPIACAAPDFDGYSQSPISRVGLLHGMQTTLDFLLNSHMQSVLAALDNKFVVDPKLIELQDFAEGKPIIRLRPNYQGRGVKDAIQQLNVMDATQNHVGDSAFLIDGMQKVSGADDAMMGHLRQAGPERLTGQEFAGTRQGAATRMERVAKLIAAQSLKDIAETAAMYTQQFMSEEQYVEVAGRHAELLQREIGAAYGDQMRVSPFDLLIRYDVEVKDGSVPGNKSSETFVHLIDLMGKYPQLAEEFDATRIVLHILRNEGVTDPSAWLRNMKAEAQPDEEVMNEVQKGNLVPMEDAL